MVADMAAVADMVVMALATTTVAMAVTAATTVDQATIGWPPSWVLQLWAA
jgi:hypothetical protein